MVTNIACFWNPSSL